MSASSGVLGCYTIARRDLLPSRRSAATEALASTFTATLLAELGDKSFFVVLLLAAAGRPAAVAAGAVLAFAALNVVAVAAGTALGELPHQAVLGLAAGLFIAAGTWLLARPGDPDEVHDDPTPGAAVGAWSAFAAAFTGIAVSELGDKTQLAVGMLAARFDAPVEVFLGGTAGLAVTTGLAAWAGSRLAGRLPLRTLRRVAGAVFVGIGAWALMELLAA